MDNEDAVAVLKAHCANWDARGISKVVCEYSGSGDEGFIQGYRYDGEWVSSLNVHDVELEDAFESLTFAEVSGNDEGGGGEITVHVQTKKVTRSEYYYESRRTPVSPKPAVLGEK